MKLTKIKSLLLLLLLSLNSPSQASSDALLDCNNISLHNHHRHSSCHCHEEGTETIILDYKTPSVGGENSTYGIYISVLTINTETVITDKELFRILRGPKQHAPFRINLKPTETIVAFAVSFDHNFATFSTENVGTLTATVNCESIPITLSEYQPNMVVGFFNPI